MAASSSIAHLFTADERLLFASLSGDVNPMHVDPVAARRTQAGAPVVHGMHMVLWAVDALIAADCIAAPIATLKVQFQKFVYDDDEIILSRIRLTDSTLRTSLAVDGSAVATLDVGFGPPPVENATPLSTAPVSTAAPAVLDMADLPGRAGWLTGIEDQPIARLFPRAAERLGIARVGALARISALVGMVCPGMHSMSGSYSIKLARDQEQSGLSFAVQNVDERFRRVEMAVAGSGIIGTVTAFLRQPPVEQRSLREIRGRVAADEFRGSTALIVGGSRGLGALTARVLAAGGGRVAITYAVGEAEAREIEAEIGPDACRVLRYDVRESAAEQLALLDWEVSQLYYFATPHMFRPKAAPYVPHRFAEFCRIYVDGFHAVCTALLARSTIPLWAFYPSAAVEGHSQDATEFTMAKAAGEMLCADMNRFLRGLRVLVSRLPRVSTDQTATVTPLESSNALEVMLPIIREMYTGAGHDGAMALAARDG